jgi:DNA-binding MarR family transcriptional regulator
VEIRIPAKPDIKEQPDKGEDLRKFAVVPFNAIKDKRIKHHALRVLAAICAHSNRAGVSYAGQRTLARFLNTSQSTVSNSMRSLKETGYIRVIGKSVQGLRGETLQVMYAPDMTIEDAVAIASAKTSEDLRPPEQREQELAEMIADNEKQWTEQELRENKERLAKMLLQAYQTPTDNPRMYEPVAGDTLAVKKAKQEIRARMRQIRKQELADNHDRENRSKHKYLCSDIENRSLDSGKTDCDAVKVSEQRTAMSYMAIVEFLNNELFEQVKTESDMQGCAWLAEIGITEEILASYVRSYPSDSAYALAKRVIARGGAGC